MFSGMAERGGYIFLPHGARRASARFRLRGPSIKIGIPQPALNVDRTSDQGQGALVLASTPRRGGESAPIVILMLRRRTCRSRSRSRRITPLNPPLGLVRTLPTGIQLAGYGESSRR